MVISYMMQIGVRSRTSRTDRDNIYSAVRREYVLNFEGVLTFGGVLTFPAIFFAREGCTNFRECTNFQGCTYFPDYTVYILVASDTDITGCTL